MILAHVQRHFMLDAAHMIANGGAILQIYRNLAESVDVNSNSSTDENSQQIALLTKSKNSFYQALDRAGSDRDQVFYIFSF